MNEGWISLHRFLLKKPIWTTSTPEQKTVLIAILLMVDHSANEWEWKGKQFKTNPGEMITSYNSIIKKAGKGISLQNARSSLKRFKKYEFLTYEPTHTGLFISVTNWETYQNPKNEPNRPTNTPPTHPQHTPNTPPTPNNNVNNENNVNNKYSFSEFWEKYDKKVDKKDAKNKYGKISEKDKEIIFIHLPKYVSVIEKQFRVSPYRYLNKEKYNDEIIIPKNKKGSMKKNGFTKEYYETTKKTKPRKSYSELLKSR